jgi:hypothetical protein
LSTTDRPRPASHRRRRQEVARKSNWRRARPAPVEKWTTLHEISVDGPLRENYLRGITDTADSDEWDTEIGWPIFRTHD